MNIVEKICDKNILNYIEIADRIIDRHVKLYADLPPITDRQAYLGRLTYADAAADMATAFGCRESAHYRDDKSLPLIWHTIEPTIRTQLPSGQYNTPLAAAGAHEHAWHLHRVLTVGEHAGAALPADQARSIRASAVAAADHLLRYPDFERNNRGASCAGVLVLAGKLLNDERYVKRGLEIARLIMAHCYMPDGQIDESWAVCWNTPELGMPLIGPPKTYVPTHTGPCLNYSPVIHVYMFLVYLLTEEKSMREPLLAATEWFTRVFDPMGWAKDAFSVRIPNWGIRGGFLLPMLEYFAPDKPEFATLAANYVASAQWLAQSLQERVAPDDAWMYTRTLYLAHRLHQDVASAPVPECIRLYDCFYPSSSYITVRTRRYDTLIGLGGPPGNPALVQGGMLQFFSPMPDGVPWLYPMNATPNYPSGIYCRTKDPDGPSVVRTNVDDYRLADEQGRPGLYVHSADDPRVEYQRRYTFGGDYLVTAQTIRVKRPCRFCDERSLFTALVLNNVANLILTYASRPELMYQGTDSLPPEFMPETNMVRRRLPLNRYFILEDTLAGNEIRCEHAGRRLQIVIEGACRVAVSNNPLDTSRHTCVNVYYDIVPMIKMYHTDRLTVAPADTFDLKFTLTVTD